MDFVITLGMLYRFLALIAFLVAIVLAFEYVMRRYFK